MSSKNNRPVTLERSRRAEDRSRQADRSLGKGNRSNHYPSIERCFFEFLRKRKARRAEKKAKQLKADNLIARELAQNDWIRHNCQEIEILNRTCFYWELSGQTIFIKVKNGKVRLGHLNNFFTRSKQLDELIVRLDTLELEKTGIYEAFGAETGFMFTEVEPDPEIDFDTLWGNFQSILKNSKFKSRKALEFISIQAYQELLDQKKLLDRY